MSGTQEETQKPNGNERRDFINLLGVATAGVGAGAFAWTLVDSMNPAADVLALASTEIYLGALEQGQAITVKWRGKPVFVRHRTEKEITEAEAGNTATLIDPETDEARVINKNFLVMVGVCTHLGCVPLGQTAGSYKGEYGGWFCPCHGSHYDTSGRIRKGPAPKNLEIPPYDFISDDIIKVG